MSDLPRLIKRLLAIMETEPPLIVVFVGELSDIQPTCTSILNVLPENFVTTIDVSWIEDSTTYLKSNARWQECTVLYRENCFKYITPEQFIKTHHEWLYKQVHLMYQKQPDISGLFEVDDAYQECCMKLDRILSKYNNQCNIRTYVANRLRFYFDQAVKAQLKIRRNEILAQLHRLGE